MRRNQFVKLAALLTLLLMAKPCALLAQTTNNWHNLFDGKTLKGWKRVAGTATYKVANGAIVGSTVANSGNTFLVTEKEYGDFILELDVRWIMPPAIRDVSVPDCN